MLKSEKINELQKEKQEKMLEIERLDEEIIKLSHSLIETYNPEIKIEPEKKIEKLDRKQKVEISLKLASMLREIGVKEEELSSIFSTGYSHTRSKKDET